MWCTRLATFSSWYQPSQCSLPCHPQCGRQGPPLCRPSHPVAASSTKWWRGMCRPRPSPTTETTTKMWAVALTTPRTPGARPNPARCPPRAPSARAGAPMYWRLPMPGHAGFGSLDARVRVGPTRRGPVGGGAQGTAFKSVAAVRKSVRYWGSKRRGADMAAFRRDAAFAYC